MKQIFVFLILLSLSPVFLKAQKKWTLKECIEYARTQNINIKLAKTTIYSNVIMGDKAKLNYLPGLEFRTNYQLNVNRSLDPVTYSFIENIHANSVTPGLNFNMTLFDGLKRFYTYQKSLLELDASVTDYEALKNDVSISVITNYMNILLNKEIINSIQKQISISDSHIEKAERLLVEGMITDEQLQNLLIQRDNEEYSLADAEGNYTNSIIGLCSLLHLKNYNAFDVEDNFSFGTDEMIPLEDLLASVLNFPQVEAAKTRLKSAEYNLSIAKSDLYPILSFSAYIGSSWLDTKKKALLDENGNPIMIGHEMLYKDYLFFNQLNNHWNGYMGITLSYSLFNIFHTRKNMSLSKANRMKALYDLQSIRKNMTERIYQIYNEVKVAERKYYAALSAVEHGEKVLSFATNKLTYGTLTPSDYIVTKNNLLIAVTQVSRAKYEFFFKRELLKFYYNHTLQH
jgi:outer membrane protein